MVRHITKQGGEGVYLQPLAESPSGLNMCYTLHTNCNSTGDCLSLTTRSVNYISSYVGVLYVTCLVLTSHYSKHSFMFIVSISKQTGLLTGKEQ